MRKNRLQLQAAVSMSLLTRVLSVFFLSASVPSVSLRQIDRSSLRQVYVYPLPEIYLSIYLSCVYLFFLSLFVCCPGIIPSLPALLLRWAGALNAPQVRCSTISRLISHPRVTCLPWPRVFVSVYCRSALLWVSPGLIH